MNRIELAEKMFMGLNDSIITGQKGETKLSNILDHTQLGNIIHKVISMIPETPLEQVQRFNNAFDVEKEETHVVTDFKHKRLLFTLIIEEAIELGFSLGFSNIELYKILVDSFKSTEKEEIEPNLVNSFDALLDLLFVTYGAIDRMNLSPILEKGFKEVTDSNMSKLIPIDKTEKYLDVIKATKAKYDKQNILIRSSKTKNNAFVVINNVKTNKVMKPTSYFKPKLSKILNQFLNGKP